MKKRRAIAMVSTACDNGSVGAGRMPNNDCIDHAWFTAAPNGIVVIGPMLGRIGPTRRLPQAVLTIAAARRRY